MHDPDIPPPPVIDPGMLIAALKACGWEDLGEAGGITVLAAPQPSGVIVPVPSRRPPAAGELPRYAEQMTFALGQLRQAGVRPSLLEGVVTPDAGTLP